MQAPGRWAALAVAGVAAVALAGCSTSTSSGNSGNSGGSATSQPSIPVSTVPPTISAGASPGTLTGNFCTDVKNISNNLQVPANATGSLNELEHNGVKYLSEVEQEFNGLAGEAPGPVAKELHTIASDYQSIAKAISTKNLGSLQQIEKKMQALTSQGATGKAFRALISYMVTKCP